MTNSHPFALECYQDRCDTEAVRGRFLRRGRVIQRLLMSAAVAIYMADFVLAAPRSPVPDDRAVAKVVDDVVQAQPDYQRGDLVTRSQVAKAVAKLVSDGVKISDPEGVVKRGLADDSFLVREFSTPNGKRFMRKVAQSASGYSHLDRLSTIPRGQTLIRDLVSKKDGEKMIEYLATTKGGKNMGNMMGQVRGGVDLNTPTGRIYTADDLVAVLRDAIAKP